MPQNLNKMKTNLRIQIPSNFDSLICPLNQGNFLYLLMIDLHLWGTLLQVLILRRSGINFNRFLDPTQLKMQHILFFYKAFFLFLLFFLAPFLFLLVFVAQYLLYL